MNAILDQSQAIGTIVSDDHNVLSIRPASEVEGDSGTTNITFSVELTPASALPVSVAVATSDGTAFTADNDYLAASASLTFAPGETRKDFTVTVIGDTNAEPDEVFFADLTDPVNAILDQGQAIGTIVGDEGVVPAAPVITELLPPDQSVGMSIEIKGRNFSPTPYGNIVRFGSVRAEVTEASTTLLRVIVPPGAIYAPVTVSVAGLTGASHAPFVVTFPTSNKIDETSFAARSDLQAGSRPQDIVIGDFDDDGRPDVATVDFLNARLRIYRNAVDANSASAGIFSDPLVLTTQAGPTRLVSADLNGDGKLDLAVVNKTSSSLEVFRNTSKPGAINFAAPAAIPTPLSPTDLAVGDVNRDGRPELFVASSAGGRVTVYPNSSSVGQLAQSSFDGSFDIAAGTEPSGVRIGDLDGDGFVDIAAPNRFDGIGGNKITLFRNTGSSAPVTFASFVPAGTLNTPPGPLTLRTADLDRDGRLDLLTSNTGDNSVSAFRNLGSPGSFLFAPRKDFHSVLAPRLLGIGDVDGDGLPDLAVADESGDSVRVYKNTSPPGGGANLAFEHAAAFAAGDKPFGAVLGDMDQDGKPEIFISSADGVLSLFRNNMRIRPTIVWRAAPNLTYGEAVQSGHYDIDILPLNLEDEGQLLFNPLPGAKLEAGASRTLSVTFVPDDFANYATVSSNRTINVAKANLTITPDRAMKEYGAPLPELSATYDGLTNNDKAEDLATPPTLATPAGPFSDVGVYDITASGASDPNYNISYGPAAALTVTRATPEIAWDTPGQIPFGVPLNSTDHLNATVDVPGTLIYTPPSGALLPRAAGQTLQVNFTPDDALNYSPAVATVMVDVVSADPAIVWSAPTDIVYGTALNAVDHLNARANVPGEFVYSPPLATVLAAGLHQTLSATFTPTDSANYNPVTATVTINVLKADPPVTWGNPPDIAYGTPLNTTDHLNPATPVAGSFLFAPPAGAVLNAGTSQALTAIFTPEDTANYNSANAEVRINVNRATPAIAWDTPGPIAYGTPLSGAQLNATSEIAGSFTYSPAAGAALDASPARALSVTFTPDNRSNYETASAEVFLEITSVTPPITWKAPADIVHGTPLGSTQLNASSTVPGSFDYGDHPGAILDAGQHTLTVSFTPEDDKNYISPTTAMTTITVLRAAPVISWPLPTPIVYGTELGEAQLNASSPEEGTFAYSPDAGTILDPGNRHPLSVTFTPADTINFNQVTVQVTIDVAKKTPLITWNDPADLVFGQLLDSTQLNATADVEGTFTYNPPAGVGLGVGQHTLSVTFDPDDTAFYSQTTATATIEILKRDPDISWEDPEAIVFGAPLDSQQLNATANVNGVFVYSPPLGTILAAGMDQTLSVTFNPQDSATYNSATRMVSIDVDKAKSVLAWNAPAPIRFPAILGSSQLNAQASVPGQFVYTPPAGSTLQAGEAQPLEVVFTPENPNYTTETLTVHIDVLKADPLLTWATPAPIPYGILLGPSQLNALRDESIPGTLAYTLANDLPAEGALLDVGTGQTLRAEFTPTDGANYNAVSTTVQIDVVKAAPAITWDTPADIPFGTALDTTSHLNASSPVEGVFTYSPAAGSVLDIGSGQLLTATFTPDDAARYTENQATTRINVVRAAPEIAWDLPEDIVFGTPLSATQLNATAPVSGQLVYDPPSGSLLAAGDNQTLSVTFIPADAGRFVSTTAIVTINVLKADPEITWNDPAPIPLNVPLGPTQLNATTDIPGTFVYTPPAGSLLNAGEGQELSALFIPNDTANYNLTAATAFIDINRLTPAIDWPTPAPIVHGAPLGASQLNARAEDGLPGVFVYDPPAGTVLNAGAAQMLSVEFTPDNSDDYAPVVVTVPITVLPADVNIEWNPASPLTYGTPLSAIQYNATAPIPGSFAYDPPIGTVLRSGGGQTLTATFTPDDRTNHSITVATRQVDVRKANLLVHAEDKTRRFNTPNPSLSARFTGFVNGDTESNLATPVTLATTAGLSSPIGSYDIFASGATHPDYSILFFRGTLTVAEDLPPTVSIVRPLGNAGFAALSDIVIEARAEDDGSVILVEFFNGATKIGESSAAPFRATLMNAAIGVHSLTAKATDNVGKSTTSNAVEINVTAAVTEVKVNGSGSIDLSVVGEVGVTYLVQASEDLLTWTTIDTIVSDGTTQPVLDETLAATVRSRFYRIVEQP